MIFSGIWSGGLGAGGLVEFCWEGFVKGKMDMGVMNGGTYQIIQIWHLLMTKSKYGDHTCGKLPSEITIKYIQNLYH